MAITGMVEQAFGHRAPLTRPPDPAPRSGLLLDLKVKRIRVTRGSRSVNDFVHFVRKWKPTGNLEALPLEIEQATRAASAGRVSGV